MFARSYWYRTTLSFFHWFSFSNKFSNRPLRLSEYQITILYTEMLLVLPRVVKSNLENVTGVLFLTTLHMSQIVSFYEKSKVSTLDSFYVLYIIH